MSTQPLKATIMIIDDEPKNLDVLDAMLRQDDHEVSAFPSGALALAAATAVAPDLVLLDVRMPEMDGYEVCRRFKASDTLKDIPIIFLSALTETQDKVQAFQAGAVDYIAKPLSEAEVLARVRTHLSLRQYQLTLERLVQQRTAALGAANHRLRILDEAKTHWINMLAHELRTPLTGVFCIGEVLFHELPVDSDALNMKDDFQHSCRRVRKLIDDATTLATIDVASSTFELERVKVAEVLNVAVLAAKGSAPDVAFDLPEPLDETLLTSASTYLLKRAFTDMLATAACCTPSSGRVAVTLRREEASAVAAISTAGQGLPQEDLATFFEIGGQRTLLKGGADFGLGPALAERIFRLFEAVLTVRNGAQTGIVIEARLPLTPA
jgi:DNA-binding response OmpR family regulator